jgi:hypothetical protein
MTDLVLPKRIQRKRTRGWTMPEGAIYVGRPTQWGNPFNARPAHDPAARAEAASMHEWWLDGDLDFPALEPLRRWVLDELHLLAGHDLACWCPVGPPEALESCHTDSLLWRANCWDRPSWAAYTIPDGAIS